MPYQTWCFFCQIICWLLRISPAAICSTRTTFLICCKPQINLRFQAHTTRSYILILGIPGEVLVLLISTDFILVFFCFLGDTGCLFDNIVTNCMVIVAQEVAFACHLNEEIVFVSSELYFCVFITCMAAKNLSFDLLLGLCLSPLEHKEMFEERGTDISIAIHWSYNQNCKRECIHTVSLYLIYEQLNTPGLFVWIQYTVVRKK